MNDRVVFTVRLPSDLNDKIIELAKQKGLQKNSIITIATEEYIKKNLKNKSIEL